MPQPKLYKRGNAYYIEYYVGSERVRKSLNTKNRDIANVKFNRMWQTLYDNELRGIKTITLKNLVDLFKSTFINNSEHNRKILREINYFLLANDGGDFYMNKVSEVHVDKYIKYRKSISKRGIDHNSLIIYLIYLRKLFKFAVDKSYILKSPLDNFPLSSNNNGEIKIFTDEDLKKILKASQNIKYEIIFKLMAYTGMRIGEVRHLRVFDLDFDNEIIMIRNSEVFQTKNRKDRYVLIPEELNDKLFKLTKGKERRDYLFHKNNPISYTAVKTYFNNILRRNNIDEGYTLHTFRHYASTKMVNSGVDVYAVSKYIGHSSVRTTEDIYLHVGFNYIRDKIKGFKPFD